MQNPLKKVGLILFLLAVGTGCSLFAQDVPMPTVVVIPLENVLAEEIYQTIVRVFPEVNSDCQSNRLAPDRNSNSLVMVSFALPEFTQMIEGLVKKLDVPRKVLGQPKKELPQQAENTYNTQRKVAKAEEVASILKEYSWIRDVVVTSSSRTERDRAIYEKKNVHSVAVTVWPHTGKHLTEDQRFSITALVKVVFGITDLNEITITNANNSIAYLGSETNR